MPSAADVFSVEVEYLPKPLRLSVLSSGATLEDIALLCRSNCGGATPQSHGADSENMRVHMILRRRSDGYVIHEPTTLTPPRIYQTVASIDFFKIAVAMGCYSEKPVHDLWMKTLHRRSPYAYIDRYSAYSRSENHYDNEIRLLVNEFLDTVAPGVDAVYDNGHLHRDMIMFTLERLTLRGVAVIGFRNWLCWRSPRGIVDAIELDSDRDNSGLQRATNRFYEMLTEPLRNY